MIKTREEYQQAFIKLAHTSIDEETRIALYKTIEALREMARGSKKLLKLLELSDFPRGNEERDLDGILGALPDWITNE